MYALNLILVLGVGPELMNKAVVSITVVVAEVGEVAPPESVKLPVLFGAGLLNNYFVGMHPSGPLLTLVPTVVLGLALREVFAGEVVDLVLAPGDSHQSTRPVMAKNRSMLYASTWPRFVFGALPLTMICTPVPDWLTSA